MEKRYVRYIGEGLSGLENGDVVEVLSENSMYKDYLYVASPYQGQWRGGGAVHPENLKGRNFTYLNNEEYEEVDVPVENDSLYHITTDLKTFVEIFHEQSTAQSKCNTSIDTFDFYDGYKLAKRRLDEIESSTKQPTIPKYVRYLGGLYDSGGLVAGDICRVLSGCTKRAMFENSLYVECPKRTSYSGDDATNPENLKGHNFTYFWPEHYELVDFNIYG